MDGVRVAEDFVVDEVTVGRIGRVLERRSVRDFCHGGDHEEAIDDCWKARAEAGCSGSDPVDEELAIEICGPAASSKETDFVCERTNPICVGGEGYSGHTPLPVCVRNPPFRGNLLPLPDHLSPDDGAYVSGDDAFLFSLSCSL